MNKQEDWVLCPKCHEKTRLRVRSDTVAENIPLFCPKCKQVTVVNIKNLIVKIIEEPDAERHRANTTRT